MIPLPDEDYSYPMPELDLEEFTSPSRWYVFPVTEDGVETFIKCSLIERERHLRRMLGRG